MTIDQRKRRVLLAALPVIIALFCLTVSRHYGYTPDDTYIYLQFAKNLAGGQGISFNAGEPVYGITSPLWLFVISATGMIGTDLYTAAKLMDLVFACLALIAFYLLAQEIIGDFTVALGCTLAFSVSAWFLRWAGTGMETSLAVFLLLLAVLFCLRGEYVAAAAIAALLGHVRPEAMILIGLIIGHLFINSPDKRGALKKGAAVVLVFIALITPWLIYAYATFGSILPTTALAKAGLRINIEDEISSFMDIIKTVAVSDAAALAVLIIAGVVLTIRTGKKMPGDHKASGLVDIFRKTFIGIAWIILLCVFYIFAGANVVSRYLLLIIPLIIIYAAFFLYRAMMLSSLRRYAYAAVFLLIILMMLQNQVFYRKYVVPGIDSFQQGMETCLIPIGKWLKEHTAPHSVIFAQDIGAIGYYSGRKICDGAGLVSPEILALMRQGYTSKQVVAEIRYNFPCRADYIIFRSFEPRDLKEDPDLKVLFTQPFYRMGLAETRTNYYTVYKVIKSD